MEVIFSIILHNILNYMFANQIVKQRKTGKNKRKKTIERKWAVSRRALNQWHEERMIPHLRLIARAWNVPRNHPTEESQVPC